MPGTEPLSLGRTAAARSRWELLAALYGEDLRLLLLVNAPYACTSNGPNKHLHNVKADGSISLLNQCLSFTRLSGAATAATVGFIHWDQCTELRQDF